MSTHSAVTMFVVLPTLYTVLLSGMCGMLIFQYMWHYVHVYLDGWLTLHGRSSQPAELLPYVFAHVECSVELACLFL